VHLYTKDIIPGGPKSGASAYFCLYLLNALAKSNNFWQTLAAVKFIANTALNDIFTTERDSNETPGSLFPYKFIYPTTLIYKSSYLLCFY